MSKEYETKTHIESQSSVPREEALFDEMDSVGAWYPNAWTVVAKTITDVFSGANALIATLTGAGGLGSAGSIERKLPFVTQRYINFEFAIGSRVGTNTTSALYFSMQWWSTSKSGLALFRITTWSDAQQSLQIYNYSTSAWVTLEAVIYMAEETNKWLVVSGKIDTLSKKWVDLRLGGRVNTPTTIGIGTLADIDANPSADDVTYVQFYTDNMVSQTLIWVLDRFKFWGSSI